MRPWGALAVLALCGALWGCGAHRQAGPHQARIQSEAGQFVLHHGDRDLQARQKVERAIHAAAPRLTHWGGLREPVHVFILPSHQALEQAVGRRGYDWLRAWARYDEIFLQSPRTWSVFGAAQTDIDELMLHELTHLVMYQQASDRTHWTRKGIPLWFREGMASVTASQAYRWPTLEDLARFYEAHPERDPVGDPEPLYQRHSAMVYAAAHHAFAFFVRRYGEDRVRALLREMREEQADFRGAFERVTGLGQAAFVGDFTRYVRLRGFKSGRVIPHRASPVAPPPEPEQIAP
jgi:hypothetical protein